MRPQIIHNYHEMHASLGLLIEIPSKMSMANVQRDMKLPTIMSKQLEFVQKDKVHSLKLIEKWFNLVGVQKLEFKCLE